MFNTQYPYGGYVETTEFMEWDENMNLLSSDDFSEFSPEAMAAIEAQREQKTSDAKTFGPRFCQLFDTYQQTQTSPIDTSAHLMSLCTDHLVSFCRWARESEEQTVFIKNTLLDHDSLRAEVRNGIVMVLIYTFASMKALTMTSSPNLHDQTPDMFVALQDADQGLGIANKFSLKIYNDPFNFLTFLKSCISGLIDAGAIPDNERQNQPKKTRIQFENKDEIAAYKVIKSTLVKYLDKGDNQSAQKFVEAITTHWHQKAKCIRNRRFVSALSVVGLDGSGDGGSRSSKRLIGDALMAAPATQAAASGALRSPRGDTDSLLAKRPRPDGSFSPILGRVGSFGTVRRQMPLPPLPTLRFDRVGPQEWRVHSCMTFDVDSLLAELRMREADSTLYLVDDKNILAQCSCANSASDAPGNGKQLTTNLFKVSGATYICRDQGGIVSLSTELESAQALAATWLDTDHQQVSRFALSWQLTAIRVGGTDETPRGNGNVSPQRLLSGGGSRVPLLTYWQSGAYRQASSVPASATITATVPESEPSGGSNKVTEGEKSSNGQSECEKNHDTSAAPKGGSAEVPPLVVPPTSPMLMKSLSFGRVPSALIGPMRGALCYERVLQVGIVVRACPALGLREDIWMLCYPTEIKPYKNGAADGENNSGSFGAYLASLFPQMEVVIGRLGDISSSSKLMIIKYFGHSRNKKVSIDPAAAQSSGSPVNNNYSSTLSTAPLPVSSTSYRTLGQLKSPALSILSRIPDGAYFHDFQIQTEM
jgi:hypothetical protein